MVPRRLSWPWHCLAPLKIQLLCLALTVPAAGSSTRPSYDLCVARGLGAGWTPQQALDAVGDHQTRVPSPWLTRPLSVLALPAESDASSEPRMQKGLDHYLDSLFDPVLSYGNGVSTAVPSEEGEDGLVLVRAWLHSTLPLTAYVTLALAFSAHGPRCPT